MIKYKIKLLILDIFEVRFHIIFYVVSNKLCPYFVYFFLLATNTLVKLDSRSYINSHQAENLSDC